MEADATLPLSAEADAVAAPAPEESASASRANDAQENAFMDAMIQGGLAELASSSNLDADADIADANAAAREPAPSGDVKPNGQQPGRRASKAQEAAAEIASLRAQVAALTPAPPPDASEEARAAILATEDRYRNLLAKPDDDPDWLQDDYIWLQDEKRRRALVPDVTRHFETVLERERRVVSEAAATEREQFWQRVGQDLASAAELPGVDLAAVKAAPSFADRDRLVYAAGKAQGQAEVRALREELADAKRQILGIVRPPLNGGRSGPGRTYDENTFMDSLIRGGRA